MVATPVLLAVEPGMLILMTSLQKLQTPSWYLFMVSTFMRTVHFKCSLVIRNVHSLSVCVSFDLPGHPKTPANFSGMVAMDDTDPVTVMFTWDGLVGEGATGIPSNGDQSLNYTVSIDGTSTTVTAPMDMIEVTNLAPCTEYSATLMHPTK